MTAEERIIAYVDGELPAEARAAFEREVAADEALAAAVARHGSLAARVSGAYAPVLDEPIPPRLLAAASAANDRGRPVRALPSWAAAAAALAVGVLAGRAVWPEGPLAARHGQLVAQGGLSRALSTELASDVSAVKVGLTLKTGDGRYCRTFESAPDRLAGLACRDDGRWVARTVTAWSPGAGPAYRQAASETPPEVLAAVDALGVQPLDAAAERSARDKGWR
jgi:anti-sigma-K factor RskA